MATTPSADTVKIALCQILSGSDKLANLKTAVEAIHDAAAQNAKIVALPECFNRYTHSQRLENHYLYTRRTLEVLLLLLLLLLAVALTARTLPTSFL